MISNDADLKVLEEFEKASIDWIGLDYKATDFKPSIRFPYCLVLVDNCVAWLDADNEITIHPATDFIGSEFSGNGLTVSEPDNTISIEPSETIATLRAEKAELIEALMVVKDRLQIVISEPNGLVRETMINNLLIDLP